MLALTLIRPWPWAILEIPREGGPKDVENRVWKPPASVVGERIAIHAGKGWDPDGLAFIRALGFDCPERTDDHPLGIVGTVQIDGYIGGPDLAEGERSLYSRWYMGGYGWLMSNPVKLERPLACGGRQRLWMAPEDLTPLLTRP